MPELPEVETVVRTFRPHVLGKCVLEVDEVRRPCFVPEGLKPKEALGLKVLDVFRRGKFIVCRLGGPDARITDARDFRSFEKAAREREGTNGRELFWVTHLRMTGTLMAYEGQDRDKESARIGRHTRFRALLGKSPDAGGKDGAHAPDPDGTMVLFNDQRTFGRMFLGERERLLSWSSWARLGPEPLDMGEEAFVCALKGRRAVKTVLMDQTVVAGIGNIYADESLFAAGIWPGIPAEKVSESARARLYAELVRLLNLSIEECGSSIRDYHDADGNVGAFQNHFQVYGRGGEKCLSCGRTLKKIVLGGRGTVYCPHCQKRPA